MHYWYWFIAAAALFALEMFSGTFYLLVVSIALLGAGIAAWLGAGSGVSLLVAVLLSAAGIAAVYRIRRKPPMPKAIWTSATPCCCTNPNPAACGSCSIAAPIGRPKHPSPRRLGKPRASPGNPATF